jgi:hypothetical protein
MTLKTNIDGVNRDMTADEQTDYLAWQTEKQAKIANNELEANKKQALKTATLEKLGLTASEVAALLS